MKGESGKPPKERYPLWRLHIEYLWKILVITPSRR
jgi:hypothetical protein